MTKEPCCETFPINIDKPKPIKETILTEEDIGNLGYICVRPDFALKGDFMKDKKYVIKVIKDGFGTVLDISRRK